MPRTRYTIEQTLIDIQKCKERIIEAKKIEELAHTEYILDSYIASRTSHDPWVRWEAEHTLQYIDSEQKSYQRCISARMKIEKELRLLEKRLVKLQSQSENLSI